MAIEDLDLEFEDDGEEGGKSGGDAVNIDIDLSFSASPGDELVGAIKGTRSKPIPKKSPSKTGVETKSPKLKVVDSGDSLLSLDLEEKNNPVLGNSKKVNTIAARPSNAQNKNLNQVKTSTSNNVISSASQEVQVLQEQINQLQEQLARVEDSANIRVAIAESEKNYLVEYISNAKVLDIQITQTLLKMNSKAPALKAESQQIKKLLNDFLAKSNPKK
jgi:hypothetical protein